MQLKCSAHQRQPPDCYSPRTTCQVTVEPQSYNELSSLSPEEKAAWDAAVQFELASLQRLKVYQDAVLPPGERAIGCKWVFKLKRGANGHTTCKARLVAQGFAQTANGYDEIFSPALKVESLRAAFLWAAKHQYSITHCDVETAYLNVLLRHVIYMQKPPGVSVTDGNDCWLLRKSLYGLKQSGFEWNQCITKALSKLGFKAGLAEPCLFTRHNGNYMSLILLFTDDLALITETDREAKEIIQKLQKEFSIRNLGKVGNYLVLEITEIKNGYKLSQSQKIMQLLQKYIMEQCKTAKNNKKIHGARIQN